jgi:hypothetical protein
MVWYTYLTVIVYLRMKLFNSELQELIMYNLV